MVIQGLLAVVETREFGHGDRAGMLYSLSVLDDTAGACQVDWFPKPGEVLKALRRDDVRVQVREVRSRLVGAGPAAKVYVSFVASSIEVMVPDGPPIAELNGARKMVVAP
jgi:hypothetical protein